MFSVYNNNYILIKPLINNYNWLGINYPSKIEDSERFEKIIQQLLLMFPILKKKKYVQLIFQKFIQIEKKIILLMIPNEEKEDWDCDAVKKLLALLTWITSKNNKGFYFLNCFHSFRTNNKFKPHETIRRNRDFCRIIFPT